jgi:hypothetical protein
VDWRRITVAVFLALFWIGVGYGLSQAFGLSRADGVTCVESQPPLPQIGTAITCHN